jgi:hypothetical protein
MIYTFHTITQLIAIEASQTISISIAALPFIWL